MIRLVLLGAVWGFSFGLCGCTPAADASAAKAAVYAAELQACVAHAETLAQSRHCRCETAKRYGRECDK